MIICKPHDISLTFEDVKENIDLKTKFLSGGDDLKYKVSVTYVDGENAPLGFVECPTISYLKEMIEWINSEKITAMIHLREDDFSKEIEFPYFINANLCCALEGYFSKYPTSKVLLGISALAESINNFLNPGMIWVLDKLTPWNNSLILLDNTGKFTYFNTHCRYSWKGIEYSSYGKISKYTPITPPNITRYCNPSASLPGKRVITGFQNHTESYLGVDV